LWLGRLGIAGLAIATVPLVAPGPELVPAAIDGGPRWILGLYGDGFGIGGGAYYGFLWLAFLSYLAIVAGASALSPRSLWAAIGVAVVAFALAPPLLSQDVFSYISYARLGVEHGLNPYTETPAAVPGDEAFRYVGWRDTVSAYGPLFTLLTYPLAPLSVPLALAALKALAAASVIGLALLCARLAPARGVEPRCAAAFVALNPLVLVHVVGGGHNDATMMLALVAGCAALLAAREVSAGALLVGASAIKVSAAFAAPFAVLGAGRRGRLLLGIAGGLAATALASLLAFGPHALDAVGLAGENQATTSHYSVPATTARLLGIDSDPVRIAFLAAYAIAVLTLARRVWQGDLDWLLAAGWAAFGLLIATGWLLPWYLIWALPLAAIAADRRLGWAVLALTAFQLLNRVPL
jgi:hypothetical protein